MSGAEPRLLIGYSIFDSGQECYEYNEDACFIAATRESAQKFLNVACLIPQDGRVHPVSWESLLQDYGCSCGEYAMEADAFERFRRLAAEHQVAFEAQAYDGDDSLMVVDIGSQFLTPDPD